MRASSIFFGEEIQSVETRRMIWMLPACCKPGEEKVKKDKNVRRLITTQQTLKKICVAGTLHAGGNEYGLESIDDFA
jgi:hypothetical protein